MVRKVFQGWDGWTDEEENPIEIPGNWRLIPKANTALIESVSKLGECLEAWLNAEDFRSWRRTGPGVEEPRQFRPLPYFLGVWAAQRLIEKAQGEIDESRIYREEVRAVILMADSFEPHSPSNFRQDIAEDVANKLAQLPTGRIFHRGRKTLNAEAMNGLAKYQQLWQEGKDPDAISGEDLLRDEEPIF